MNVGVWTSAMGRTSLETVVAVLGVALLVRLLPRLPASARCGLWWLASLRALIGLAGLPGIELPLLPATAPSLGDAPVAVLRGAGTAAAAANDGAVPGVAAATAIDPFALASFLLFALWAAGCAAILVRHARDARRVLEAWRDAVPLASAAPRRWLVDWLGAGAAGVELRMSTRVDAPLILGWGRPRILLPATRPGTDPARARMALAHEAGHLQRRDLWWGWVPALAESVFWFHPAVRWSVREYAQAREEACDARAIELTGAEPGGYGEMLVDFGVDRARFGHAAASCGSRHVRQLTRRLHMLSHLKLQSRSQRMVAAAALLFFGLFALVPLRVVAANRPGPAAAEPHRAAPAVAATPTTVPPPTLQDDLADATGETQRDADDERGASGFSYSWDDEGDRFSYGLLSGDDDTFSGSFGNRDWNRLRRIRDRHPGRILWFHIDGRDYVVRDRATWNQVRDLMKPQLELGRRQGELGARQSELGAQQARLGGEQAELGARQAELALEISRLNLDASFGDATRAERDALRRRIDEVEERVRALSRQQREFGEKQRALGDRQRELGDRQRVLGERQRDEGRKARSAVRRLAEQCIRDGRAERWED